MYNRPQPNNIENQKKSHIKKSKSSSQFKGTPNYPCTRDDLVKHSNKTIRNYVEARLNILKINSQVASKTLKNFQPARNYRYNSPSNKTTSTQSKKNSKKNSPHRICKDNYSPNILEDDQRNFIQFHPDATDELNMLKSENQKLQQQIAELKNMYNLSQKECSLLKNKINVLMQEKAQCYCCQNLKDNNYEGEKNCSINSLSLSDEEK